MAEQDWYIKWSTQWWLGSGPLRGCSLEARAIYADLRCTVAQNRARYGYAGDADGNPWGDEKIARRIGCPVEVVKRACDELVAEGVVRRDKREVLHCPQLVQDMERRRSDTIRKRKSRKCHTQCHSDVTLSISSSESGHKPEETRFAEFWRAWPQHKRKSAKRQCAARWRSHGLDEHADAILAALEAWKRSPDWTKAGGDFIPAPLTWLNQERWEAAPRADAADDGMAPLMGEKAEDAWRQVFAEGDT